MRNLYLKMFLFIAGGRSLASRKCLPGNGMAGIWGDPVLYNCGKYDEFDISDLENTTVSEGNVIEVAMALTDVTEKLGEGGITADDISNIADVIVDIVDVESNDSQVSKDYVFSMMAGICLPFTSVLITFACKLSTTNTFIKLGGFKTQPPVDWRFCQVPGGCHCLEQ